MIKFIKEYLRNRKYKPLTKNDLRCMGYREEYIDAFCGHMKERYRLNFIERNIKRLKLFIRKQSKTQRILKQAMKDFDKRFGLKKK